MHTEFKISTSRVSGKTVWIGLGSLRIYQRKAKSGQKLL